MNLRSQVVSRIESLLKYPKMWGSTTEAVELQFLLLIEVLQALDKAVLMKDTFEDYKRFIHRAVPDIGATTLSGYFGDDAFDQVVEVLSQYMRASSKG